MPHVDKEGMVGIGDQIEWEGHWLKQDKELLPKSSTVVEIVDVEGLDFEQLTKRLPKDQVAISGKNLLDDPNLDGKVDPKKVYVMTRLQEQII